MVTWCYCWTECSVVIVQSLTIKGLPGLSESGRPCSPLEGCELVPATHPFVVTQTGGGTGAHGGRTAWRVHMLLAWSPILSFPLCHFDLQPGCHFSPQHSIRSFSFLGSSPSLIKNTRYFPPTQLRWAGMTASAT